MLDSISNRSTSSSTSTHVFPSTTKAVSHNNSSSSAFSSTASNSSNRNLNGIIHLPYSSNSKGDFVSVSEVGDYSEDNQTSVIVEQKNSADDVSEEDVKPVQVLPEIATVRFEHRLTREGHHILTGREGKLLKCEDEPIHVPGAVQGYGVLVALIEDQETGNLVVRQVSENATEILGLSPNYLFGISSFTNILSSNQEAILRDNLEFLLEFDAWESSQRANAGEDAINEDGPTVFLLSGFGQPGSSLLKTAEKADEDEDTNGEERREWTCWCAAHKPTLKDPQPGVSENLIILELELERDIFNPLYPPVSFNPQFASHPSKSESSSGSAGSETIASKSSGGAAGSGSMSGNGSGGTTKQGGVAAGIYESTVGDNSGQTVRPSLQELRRDTSSMSSSMGLALPGLDGLDYSPSQERLAESTSSSSKPIRALEKIRRAAKFSVVPASSPSGSSGPGGDRPRRTRPSHSRRAEGNGVGTVDVFAVLSQVNAQLSAAEDMESFLKIAVGNAKDLTQFSRCLVYQFDSDYNGLVVSELVDWSQTHDLYRGLNFPASDIPAQARELYKINKVRLLYDREQTTARLILRSQEDLKTPLDLTHSFLRAMSPIHIKYLGNMGVRSSMSISIMAFGKLWGLIACHSYGRAGMRVSFPVRQMLKLFSDAVGRNIERLSYSYRLQTRQLISTLPSDGHPEGHIISNPQDLLTLFDCDDGVLVIGDNAKILGSAEHGEEILAIAEWVRNRKYQTLLSTESIASDLPELENKIRPFNGIIAGVLVVPLSPESKDVVCFLRKGQVQQVTWAGKPYKSKDAEDSAHLEPRKSFKAWSESVAGRSRVWTSEQLETAGVLSLVYGKFIEVWREKESVVQQNERARALLDSVSHDVRTPLNQLINYLELALEKNLEPETRENLSKSHFASKSLLFTINDLLDLTRVESGQETSFQLPFSIRGSVDETLSNYIVEAKRRRIGFYVNFDEVLPDSFVGDSRLISTVISNLVDNALQHTDDGFISVDVKRQDFQNDLAISGASSMIPLQIEVMDTGSGIPKAKLENIFATLESVERTHDHGELPAEGLGLGLAVVSRVVERLDGSMRVDSEVDHGTKFTIFLSLALSQQPIRKNEQSVGSSRSIGSSSKSELENVVDALSSSHMSSGPLHQDFTPAVPHTSMSNSTGGSSRKLPPDNRPPPAPTSGTFDVADSRHPLHAVKLPESFLGTSPTKRSTVNISTAKPQHITPAAEIKTILSPQSTSSPSEPLIKAPSQASPYPESQRGAPEPTFPMGADLATAQKAVKTKARKADLKYRAVVVDDDDINRRMLSKRIEKFGYGSTIMKNGQQSVDLVKADRQWDVILMDLNMPILNGWDATLKIRRAELKFYKSAASTPLSELRKSTQLNRRIPVLAVSAACYESDKEKMIGSGFDGWILKPIDNNRLQEILAGIFDQTVRKNNTYRVGYEWERGGWFFDETPAITPALSEGSSSGSGGSTDGLHQ